MSKILTYVVYVLIGLGALAVLVWATWPSWHKDIGKTVVKNTNAIVTQQQQATNATVAKKETDTNAKINGVVRRTAQAAGSVRVDNRPDPVAYNAWLDSLCANDIYSGYADCAGRGGQPASQPTPNR